MKERKKRKLQAGYKRLIELCLIVSLLFHIGFLQGYKKWEVRTKKIDLKLEGFDAIDIPVVSHERRAAQPERPTEPIASESEELTGDETIDPTDPSLWGVIEAPPPPPPPDEDEPMPFFPHDEEPIPIGGYAAIIANLEYPDMAKKAGVEGRVIVGVLIDNQGRVAETRILKSLPAECNQAAIDAIKSVRWKPAKQRDRAVKVWISISVDFQLKK